MEGKFCAPPSEKKEITVKAHCEGMTADCGLFALAFVTAAVHGHNPIELYFDQGKMRPHLIESLKRWRHHVSRDKNPKEEKGTALIPVYYICRLSDSRSQMEDSFM